MAAVHSRHIRGALAFWETHRMLILDAVGADVVKWELKADDFQDTGGSGTDPRGYVTTVVESGGGGTSEAEASDEEQFAAELVTDNAENDGITLQRVGEAFVFDSDHDVYFGIRLQVNDADQIDFLVGLAISDTALLGGVSDAVYLESLDGSTDVDAVTEKDSTETQTSSAVGTLADDTDITLEFYWDGSTVYFFVDGAQQATSTTNVPDDEALTPSIEFLTGETTANRAKVSWARAVQIGRS